VQDFSEHSDRSPSIPSLQTALFGARGRSSRSSGTSAAAVPPAATATCAPDQHVSPISNDQERQILLLLLLAQVCSLHDSTPRTYTVHVLQLFERGILDRESIQFLFELGLVPPIETRDLLTEGTSTVYATETTATAVETHQEECETVEIGTSSAETLTTIETPSRELALTVTKATSLTRVHHVTQTIHSSEVLRSLEAKAIRRQLSQHDLNQEKKRNGASSCSDPQHSQTLDETGTPWEVEHFPLSLSRYQREFSQISLLNRGGFGSVFHVVRKMDGCDYAMKLITFDSVGYSNDNIQKVVREVQCLAKVSEHPNIVRYYTSWLEPSWMTGGTGGPTNGQQNRQLQQLQYDAINNASPQKLLKDIENLLDTSYDVEGVVDNDTSILSPSSESSRSFSDSDEDSSISCSHRRGYSWDSSVPSKNETSWKHNQRFGYDFAPWADPFNMSGASSSVGPDKFRSSQKPRHTSPRHKQYKYQVTLYIQMQLCHPATLEDWIRERNRQVPETDYPARIGPALDIFHQLCSGLAHIHEKNIVHRDLKPANAFVSKDGKVIKIGDFGLSKEINDIAHHDSKPAPHRSPKSERSSPINSGKFDSSHGPADVVFESMNQLIPVIPRNSRDAIVEYNHSQLNEPMTVGIGTASYAAPEQTRSKHYGTPADIFSLGLILLELCCNFETQHEKLHNFQQCRNQKVPRWLEEHYPNIASTILSCTRRNPRERPTATELLNLSEVASPKSNLDVQLLKGQLVEKERLLAEKEKMIKDLQLEMERMRATLLLTNGPCTNEDRNREDLVCVENTTTFEVNEE
jgi:serine/threonine protein kinase